MTSEIANDILEKLANPSSSTRWISADGDLSDADMPAISKAIRNHSNLEYINFTNCEITARGVEMLVDALCYNPKVRALNLDGCPIGEKGALMIAEMLSKKPEMTSLTLSRAEGEGTWSEAVMDAFREAATNPLHPNLFYCNFGLNVPVPSEIENVIARNHALAAELLDLLQAQTVTAGFAATGPHTSVTEAKASTQSINLHNTISDYIRHTRPSFDPIHLDEITTKDDLEKRTDAEGHRLLDNPNMWKNIGAIAQKLDEAGTPITKDYVMKTCSHKGGTVLHNVTIGGSLPAVIQVLNARGERLGAKELLNETGAPNQLFQTIIDHMAFPALFTQDNWIGASKSELIKVVRAMPKDTQQLILNRQQLALMLDRDQAQERSL